MTQVVCREAALRCQCNTRYTGNYAADLSLSDIVIHQESLHEHLKAHSMHNNRRWEAVTPCSCTQVGEHSICPCQLGLYPSLGWASPGG